MYRYVIVFNKNKKKEEETILMFYYYFESVQQTDKTHSLS